MTLVMVAMLGVALAMFLLSTAMAGMYGHAQRRTRQVVPKQPPAPSPGSDLTLWGEALFATSLEPDAVLLDCMVGLRPEMEATPAPLQPVSLRVRQMDLEAPELLSGIVRSWAQRGDRVFIELAFSAARCRARLCCGERSMTVAVDNGGQVWRTIGRTAPVIRGQR